MGRLAYVHAIGKKELNPLVIEIFEYSLITNSIIMTIYADVAIDVGAENEATVIEDEEENVQNEEPEFPVIKTSPHELLLDRHD
ncbi:hypothetical protein Ciccas_012702 [Cichlidogyrus casuarinus]|uniref:Uncharacterized protein n=1 Tax=Cichlidogyrus casuarinus TaxID=1844966 RepID=A0ABD2PMM9_9PLAT